MAVLGPDGALLRRDTATLLAGVARYALPPLPPAAQRVQVTLFEQTVTLPLPGEGQP